MPIRGLLAILMVTAPLALVACDAAPEAAREAAAPARSVSVGADRREAASAERGRKLFSIECAGCHGDRGRGDGPAASMLPVLPRNFLLEKFKYRSTDYGDSPTRQDIFESVTKGLDGSGMPAFGFLPEQDRWDLVEAVRGFAGLAGKPDGTVVPVGPEIPGGHDSLARGRKLFEDQGCVKCHGDGGLGDGPSAAGLKDDLGRSIKPRSLAGGGLRRGGSAAAVLRTLRTGLAGTPMPAFATNNLSEENGWHVARYAVSMASAKAAPPADPVELGRFVVGEKKCNACHVIEGAGGRVGPSLDVAAGKLRFDWAKRFLKDPRPFGKIYPYIPYRMPDLGLTDAEIDGVLALFAKIAGRVYPEPAAPLAKLDGAHDAQGQLLYFLRCTECHNFGSVVPTPLAKQQGPDLIKVTERLRVEWLAKWITDPKAVYPDTRMTNPGLTPVEVDAVRSFIWNTAVEHAPQKP